MSRNTLLIEPEQYFEIKTAVFSPEILNRPRVSDEALLAEYELVINKQSTRSATERRAICRAVVARGLKACARSLT